MEAIMKAFEKMEKRNARKASVDTVNVKTEKVKQEKTEVKKEVKKEVGMFIFMCTLLI